MPLRTRFLDFLAAHEEFGAYSHLGPPFDDDFVLDVRSILTGDAPTTHDEEQGQAFPFWWPFESPWPFDPPADTPSEPAEPFILFDRTAFETALAAMLETHRNNQPDLPDLPGWPFG